MKKILFLAKTLTKGGAASGAANLLNALHTAKAEVIVLDAYVKQSRRPIGLLRSFERVCEHLLSEGAETHFLRLGPPVFNLVQLYEKFRPDIIQLCDVSGNVIRFSDISKIPCPVIHRMSDFWPYHGAYHYAETQPQSLNLAEHLLNLTIFNGYNLPSMRVAPSDWLANKLLVNTPNNDNICVIRNAVTCPENIEPRQQLRHPLRLGFISDPITRPRKGFSTLHYVLTELSRRQGVITLDLFGRISPDEIPYIPGVEVQAHGTFRRADLAEVYKTFDILLCPSRQDNSPNVITEALAHGVPVIGQSNTGMATYIESAFGALIDFYDEGSAASSLVKAIEPLIQNFSQASQAAMAYARQELSPEIVGNRYLSLYEKLIAVSSMSDRVVH